MVCAIRTAPRSRLGSLIVVAATASLTAPLSEENNTAVEGNAEVVPFLFEVNDHFRVGSEFSRWKRRAKNLYLNTGASSEDWQNVKLMLKKFNGTISGMSMWEWSGKQCPTFQYLIKEKGKFQSHWMTPLPSGVVIVHVTKPHFPTVQEIEEGAIPSKDIFDCRKCVVNKRGYIALTTEWLHRQGQYSKDLLDIIVFLQSDKSFKFAYLLVADRCEETYGDHAVSVSWAPDRGRTLTYLSNCLPCLPDSHYHCDFPGPPEVGEVGCDEWKEAIKQLDPRDETWRERFDDWWDKRCLGMGGASKSSTSDHSDSQEVTDCSIS